MMSLLDLIEEHRPAFEHDWRSRLHCPLSEVGESMTWGEAIRHTVTLSADPSSYVGAAVNGLQFPATREYLALQRLNANFMARYTERRARFTGLPDPFERPPRKFGTPMGKAALVAVLEAHRALPATAQEATII